MSTSRTNLVDSLTSKSYRHKLVAEHLKITTAAQIKAMRESRGWKQRELAELAGVKQNWISQVESPDHEGFTLRTLKKLGMAFDVALILRYVPFSQFADWIASLEMRDLAPPGFEDDAALFKPVAERTQPPMLHPEATIPSFQQPLPMLWQLAESPVRPMRVSTRERKVAMHAS